MGGAAPDHSVPIQALSLRAACGVAIQGPTGLRDWPRDCRVAALLAMTGVHG